MAWTWEWVRGPWGRCARATRRDWAVVAGLTALALPLWPATVGLAALGGRWPLGTHGTMMAWGTLVGLTMAATLHLAARGHADGERLRRVGREWVSVGLMTCVADLLFQAFIAFRSGGGDGTIAEGAMVGTYLLTKVVATVLDLRLPPGPAERDRAAAGVAATG